MTSAAPPPSGSSELRDELAALTPEADWHPDGDALVCSLGHGTATVRPGANGGWEIERHQDGQVVDSTTVHEGIDGSAAEQVADVVLGWGA